VALLTLVFHAEGAILVGGKRIRRLQRTGITGFEISLFFLVTGGGRFVENTTLVGEKEFLRERVADVSSIKIWLLTIREKAVCQRAPIRTT